MVTGLRHQKEKRSMDHFAGLDVSVKETSVCIVDDTGKIVREVKVASEPDALLPVCTENLIRRCIRLCRWNSLFQRQNSLLGRNFSLFR